MARANGGERGVREARGSKRGRVVRVTRGDKLVRRRKAVSSSRGARGKWEGWGGKVARESRGVRVRRGVRGSTGVGVTK